MGAVALHDIRLVDAPALIPEGEYQAYYLKHETAFIFRSPKVFLHFRIYGGEQDGVCLFRAYRVKRLRGKPRRNGGIELRHSHELYRQFVRLSGAKVRPDRLSLARLKGCLLKVSVRTVNKDAKQRHLPEALKYSVIDELLAIEAGSL